jgi:hypothetical protein
MVSTFLAAVVFVIMVKIWKIFFFLLKILFKLAGIA